MTVSQLLKRSRGGDRTAQKALYDQYVVQMFLVCRRYVKDDCVAQECMLNGFLKFFHSLQNFKYQTDEAVGAWLKKIIVNECLQHLRLKKSFVLVAESEALEIAIDDSSLDKLTEEEIYKLILLLPTGYRTVFNLYVLEGMSHKEIAAALGIAEGTSKSQLSKAKQMLQQSLIANNADYAGRRAK